jgi:hypothetical protein
MLQRGLDGISRVFFARKSAAILAHPRIATLLQRTIC